MVRRWDENGNLIQETPRRRWDAQGREVRSGGAQLQRGSRQELPWPLNAAAAAVNPLGAARSALEQVAETDTTAGGIASGFNDGMSFAWGDELGGAEAGLGAMLRGERYGPAYTRERDRRRGNLAEQQRARPIATGGGQLGGAIVSGFIPGGAVTRGTSALGRFGISSGIGAGTAGLYAAGGVNTNSRSLQGDLIQRAPAAAEGVAMGAALGGAFQGAFEVAPALVSAGRRALRLPDYRGQGVAGGVVEDLTRTAQNGMRGNQTATLDDVARMTDDAAARDPNMMVAEALGPQGVQRLAYLARARGQTGQRVEDAVTQRNRNQLGEMENAFLGRAPATGDDLEQQVQAMWRERGPELYRPVLSQRPTGEALRAYNALRQSGLFQHRAVQTAWQRAQAMIGDDIALGRIPQNAANSFQHQLHYAKVALDDMIANPQTLESGIRNMNNASIIAAREQLLSRIERIIPGYNNARSQMADVGAARSAIQMGRQAFTRQRFQSPEALARHVGKLSPGERPYFIAGVEDAISNMIVAAGRDGQRNVAGNLLGEGFQRRLRAVFGQEADAMIERARVHSAMFESGNRARPTRGAITSNMAFEAADAGAPPVPSQSGMIDAAWRWGWNNSVGRVNEQHRNLLGRVYSMPVSEFRQARGGLLSRARRENERRLAQSRLRRTQGAVLTGMGAAGIVDPREEQR